MKQAKAFLVKLSTTSKRMKFIRIVGEGIVEHWKYFSMMYRLHWYFYAILNGGWFSEFRPIYQGCRALTFALARLSCKWHIVIVITYYVCKYKLTILQFTMLNV